MELSLSLNPLSLLLIKSPPFQRSIRRPPSSPLSSAHFFFPSSALSHSLSPCPLRHSPSSIPCLWLVGMHKNLMDTGFYLGDKSVLKNVCWVQDGHANCLVVEAVTTTIRNGDPDSESKTNSPLWKYPSPLPNDSEDVELMPLSAIVWICDQDFWLTFNTS